MHRICFTVIGFFFMLFYLNPVAADISDLPVHLGMERTELEEVLHAPLFSYAKTFQSKTGRTSSAVSYALYKVPDWGGCFPAYILAFFLDGFTLRLISIYNDQNYHKTAWNIANQNILRKGRQDGIEYYFQKNNSAYYILQQIYPTDQNSIINSSLRDLIFQTTGMSHINIIYCHDPDMFALLYQSVKDINLFSEIFKSLMKQPPSSGENSKNNPKNLPEYPDAPVSPETEKDPDKNERIQK